MGSNKEEKRKHIFTWKLENFSMCLTKKREKLFSPAFKARSFHRTTWCLQLLPRGDMTSCYLIRKKDDDVPIIVECDYVIEVINKNGNNVPFFRGTNKFNKGTSLGNHMKTEELTKNSLFDDTLIIRCTLYKNIPAKEFYSQNTSTTLFKTSKYSFQWNIKNLNSITHQEVITLPYAGSSQIKIAIRIPEDDVKICIFIEDISCPQFIFCNFMLLDDEGKQRDSRQATHLYESPETWDFPTFIKRNQLIADGDKYIKDGFFTLHCDITASDGSIVEDSWEREDLLPLTSKPNTFNTDAFDVLKEDIRRMYADKIHADIKLKACKEVFPAHKSILCSRSPVFLAMFENDMAESQKGEIDIPDMDSKIMDIFLEYLYTGTVNELDYENTTKLMVVADKYQVLSLKHKCAEFLSSILSEVNVCEILFIADLVQHDTLKASAFDYIKKTT